jgi:predicted enzyme related to lactoylglutathione lyase
MASHDHSNQIVWVDSPVHDLDRAIRFYSAVLGCVVEKQSQLKPDGSTFFLGILPHEGTSVGGCLHVSDSDSPSDHGVLIYLNCNGRLQDAVSAVEPYEGRVLAPIHGMGPYGSRCIVLDSEGNRLALHSM